MIDDDVPAFEHGDRVEVRQKFDGRFVKGFVVERAAPDGFIVRREHDGFVLPDTFAAEDVRHERRRFHFFRH